MSSASPTLRICTFLPHTSCCSHRTHEKGKARLKAVWRWKCRRRICVSFLPCNGAECPRRRGNYSAFRAASLFCATEQLPRAKACLCRAKDTSTAPFQLLSFYVISHSPFCFKKKVQNSYTNQIITVFKIPALLCCITSQACLLHTNRQRTLSRFQLPTLVMSGTVLLSTDSLKTMWLGEKPINRKKKAIKNWL